MNTKVHDILRRNQLSVTESREKILNLFLTNTRALAHADIEHKAGERFVEKPLLSISGIKYRFKSRYGPEHEGQLFAHASIFIITLKSLKILSRAEMGEFCAR